MKYNISLKVPVQIFSLLREEKYGLGKSNV